MSRGVDLLPVNVLTGFLGSGKTTLLRHMLASPAFADTAVLINEFGEVGLDHHLIERVDEGVVLLQSGCICCTIRSDLQESVRDLYSRRERGQIPAFQRLVIETTGLADPVPIVSTVISETVIRNHFRLGNVICTVDAVNGAGQLDRQPESVKQAAIADRLVITKVDLADQATVAVLRARLRRLNPVAAMVESVEARINPDLLLTHDLHHPDHKAAEVARWLDGADSETDASGHGHVAHGTDVNRHDDRIAAFALTFDQPLDWTAFGLWLTMLLHAHGDDVLRVKGILNVMESATPVVIHGVQRVVHPPLHLSRWPDDERRSRIVFITRDIPRSRIERSLSAFNGLGTLVDAAA